MTHIRKRRHLFNELEGRKNFNLKTTMYQMIKHVLFNIKYIKLCLISCMFV